MSFAENLKRIRKEQNLSQEELAELLDVSRQAVSKWEQGMGYPEVETLLLLSGKLNISLDALMSSGFAGESDGQRKHAAGTPGTVLITSPHENVVVSCYKVMTSGKMRGGKTAPQYALFGVSMGSASFWGEPNTFLGWYANKELLSKEVEEISDAIRKGIPAYTLQYSAKTRRCWAGIKLVEEASP